MKILFIYPSIDPAYPLQIGALSAYVKRYKHQTKLLMFPTLKFIERPEDIFMQITATIRDFNPQLIAFSCYEMSFPVIKQICVYIKKEFKNKTIIVGGYYATLAPDEVMKVPEIDVLCRGEGELPMVELLRSMEKGKPDYGIKNLWFRVGNTIRQNPLRPLMEDLDVLPFPDRTILNYQKQLNTEQKGQRNIKVMATRGCPYQCTYCCNKYLRQVTPNPEKYLRYRSPKNVIRELKELKTKYEFDTVGFHDDNLTLNRKWLEEFMVLYKNEINIPFYCAARVESCPTEVLKLLKDAGCYLILLGVESGNTLYRKERMNRYMSNDIIIDVFRRARELGIKTWSFTMVGLPLETHQMLLETLWLNWRCRPDFVMASIFYPLKGTELGDFCYKNNWVNLAKKENTFSYAWESVLNHPNLANWEIKLAKYLNFIPAIRSPLFWELVFSRIKSYVPNITYKDD